MAEKIKRFIKEENEELFKTHYTLSTEFREIKK